MTTAKYRRRQMAKNQTASLRTLLVQTLQQPQRDKADRALVGPVVIADDEVPYFILVTGTEKECWIDRLAAPTWELAEHLRIAIMAALIQCKPMVMHDFDDELNMARLGEAIWPSRFASIRLGIESERASQMAPAT